jgi:hypothetical protein
MLWSKCIMQCDIVYIFNIFHFRWSDLHVRTAVIVQTLIFWVATLISLVGGYWHFGGTCRLPLQDWRVSWFSFPTSPRKRTLKRAVSSHFQYSTFPRVRGALEEELEWAAFSRNSTLHPVTKIRVCPWKG